MAEKLQNDSSHIADGATIKDYADKYIEKKRIEGRSPTTIRGYMFIVENTPGWFLERRLFDVTEDEWQRAVNEYYDNGKRSPKTVRNMNGLYKAVLGEFRPKTVFTIKLPQAQKKSLYEPSTKDIRAILKYSEGSRYHIILQLAANGLRKGEAVAITAKDIDADNVLTISKDIVFDKTTPGLSKTIQRLRKVIEGFLLARNWLTRYVKLR